MSNKKNLLNESQIRQFMKLAKLEPLTPGFVKGLTESNTTEEDLEESHGRGRGEGPAGYGAPVDAGRAGTRLREIEDLEADPGLEGEEAVDLPVDDAAAGEVVDDVEAVEAGAEDVPTEEEVLAALQVIARAAGVEGLEIEATSTGEPSELEPEVGLEPELPGEEGPEELEEPGLEELEEGDEDELEEGSREDKWAEIAGGGTAGGSPAPKTPREISRARRYKASKKKKDPKNQPMGEGNTDELVEQITKRVAARILKSALSKK